MLPIMDVLLAGDGSEGREVELPPSHCPWPLQWPYTHASYGFPKWTVALKKIHKFGREKGWERHGKTWKRGSEGGFDQNTLHNVSEILKQ